MPFLPILSDTLPVILLVAVGFILHKINFFQELAVQDLKKLVVNLTLPLLLFKAFAAMQFESRYLLIVASVFGACTLVMWLTSRLRFLPGLSSKYASYLMAGFEAGMLGYAVFGSIYGENNISKFAVIDLGQVLFVFFILITRLETQQTQRLNWRQTVLLFVKSPVIIGILAGILANWSGVYRAAVNLEGLRSVFKAMEMIAGLTTPLVALVIGYELGFQGKSLLNSLRTLAIRLPVWVALAMAFNFLVIRQLLGLDRIFEAAVLLMAILPAPFVVPLYLREGEQEQREYIMNALSLGTLAALFGAVLVRMIY